MLEAITYRREDGSFVGVVNGMPYHITVDDPMYADAIEMAEGQEFVPEPLPPPPSSRPASPPQTPPTRAELMARLEQIAAQIAALEEDVP